MKAYKNKHNILKMNEQFDGTSTGLEPVRLSGSSCTKGFWVKQQSTSVYPSSSCADISEAGLDTGIIIMDCFIMCTNV